MTNREVLAARIWHQLEGVEEYLGNRDDRREIVDALLSSVVAQEMTRMAVTKNRMNTEGKSDIDKDRLIAYWRVLAHHYRGTKFQEMFEKGLRQMEKLTSEETENVIHEIRRLVTPTLNREMEVKEIKIGFNLPIIGKIGLGKFEWSMQGPRVSIRKFQRRLLRSICGSLLWLSVMFGTAHWIMWTMFNNPYLVYEFEGMAKVAQFVLLLPTTIFLWVFGRDEGPQLVKRGRKLARSGIWLGWCALVVGGWIYWFIWVLFEVPVGLRLLEPLLKMALPFFLVSGGFSAWLVGRIFRRGDGRGSTEEKIAVEAGLNRSEPPPHKDG